MIDDNADTAKTSGDTKNMRQKTFGFKNLTPLLDPIAEQKRRQSIHNNLLEKMAQEAQGRKFMQSIKNAMEVKA